jgi:hypothetical protein
MIAKYANLRIVPWDGYLKYYNLGEKNPGLIEKRRRVLADVLRAYIGKAPEMPQAAAAATVLPSVPEAKSEEKAAVAAAAAELLSDAKELKCTATSGAAKKDQ